MRRIVNRFPFRRIVSTTNVLSLVLLTLGSVEAQAETVVAQAALNPLTHPPRKGIFVSPRAPAPPKALNETGKSQFEKFRLFKDTIKDFQGALCAPEDGSISSLRNALAAFYRASSNPEDLAQADRIEHRGLLDSDVNILDKLLRRNPHCKTKLDGPAAVGRAFFGK